MESFKGYLLTEESTKVSTALETVLGVVYQAAYQPSTKQVEVLKSGMATYAKDFNTAKKYWQKGTEAQQIQNLLIFGKKIVDQLPGGNGKFEAQKSGKITKEWKEWGGRNNTSKTDIVVGGMDCSVKNAGGAQLMSAKKGEATATTNAASIMAGLADLSRDTIVGSLDKLQQQTTVGYYASVEHLKILKDKGAAGQTLYDYASKEKKRYETELAAWEQDYKDGKVKKKDKPKKPIKTLLSIADNPEKASLKPTLIRDANEEFINNVRGQFETNAKDALNTLKETFNNNANFKLAFVYEAASGRYKFGTKAIQTADYMLCWKPSNKGVQDFVIKVYPLTNINSPIVRTYAKAVDIQVNWKSSSTSKHLGYNVYQNLRLGIREVTDKQKENANEHYSEVWEYRQQLNEGLLDEFVFWDKVKELTSKFVEKAKELWRSFIDMFREAMQKVNAAARNGIEALSNILGFKMTTHTNADKDIRIRI